MSKPHGIILIGANGSGKSALGRELAHELNFAHFDVEDYWFYKTDIPYTAIRPHEERNEMLLSDMKKHGSFVISGDISGWGDEFLTMFDLAVFLTAPTEIRMRRIEKRECARWGDRVCEGGDMYESQKKFREFASTRDVGLLEQSALKYSCPVLRVDSTKTLKKIVDEIVVHMMENNHWVVEILKDRNIALIGFADLSEINAEIRYGYQYGINIAIALKVFPSTTSEPSKEYYDEYKAVSSKLREASDFLAEKIIERGFNAYSLAHEKQNEAFRTQLPFKTLATPSGLGWIGKSAALITKAYGNAIRMNGVLTDMPLIVGTTTNVWYDF